jgi:hypothetical protein
MAEELQFDSQQGQKIFSSLQCPGQTIGLPSYLKGTGDSIPEGKISGA